MAFVRKLAFRNSVRDFNTWLETFGSSVGHIGSTFENFGDIFLNLWGILLRNIWGENFKKFPKPLTKVSHQNAAKIVAFGKVLGSPSSVSIISNSP